MILEEIFGFGKKPTAGPRYDTPEQIKQKLLQMPEVKIPAGTRLFHGTASARFEHSSEGIRPPAFFSRQRDDQWADYGAGNSNRDHSVGNRRSIEYEVISDITLKWINEQSLALYDSVKANPQAIGVNPYSAFEIWWPAYAALAFCPEIGGFYDTVRSSVVGGTIILNKPSQQIRYIRTYEINE